MNASFSEGQLVALMGESGSGKSTLLNVLGGRAAYGHVVGSMRLNGRMFDPVVSQHTIGFVPQAYLLVKELTVAENIYFAAALRLDCSAGAAKRAEVVETILNLLGLESVAGFVCDKNIGRERLSGGQLRRVSIGVELVTQPQLLLLDEPTRCPLLASTCHGPATGTQHEYYNTAPIPVAVR
eukprot:6704100-Prymnesium_polylepis.2